MRTTHISRIVCVLLACLMLLPVVACGKTDDTQTTTTANNATTTAPAGEGDAAVTEATENTDVNGYLKDDLDPELNLNNEEYTLLYWSDREHEEFYAESQTGDLVNDAIARDLEIVCEEMDLESARSRGAMGLFGDKYGERVKVYTMGDVSCEICGGPHAARTSELGKFRILKEESSSQGVRRIKAVIEGK